MVRDFPGALSISLDELPLNSIERIVLQHVNLGEVHAPHRLNGALFKITPSMDVEIFVGSVLCNERAVVGTTLRQLALEAQLNPAIALYDRNNMRI